MRDYTLPVVTLQLDDSVLDGAAGAGKLLERPGKFRQRGVVRRQAVDRGHGLAAPAGALDGYTDDPVAWEALCGGPGLHWATAGMRRSATARAIAHRSSLAGVHN